MAEANVPGPAAAAIYDLGYQGYGGQRFGRLYSIKSLWLFSLRTAFGLGRGDKAKSMPAVAVLAVYIPAVLQLLIAAAFGADRINYAQFLEYTSAWITLFAASQAPELIVTDKQQGVLSLYLSRPLLAADYALAKIGALIGALLVITLGPQLILFGGKTLISATPMKVLEAEWTKLFPMIGGTLLTSIFVGAVALWLSSFASRRGYGTAAVLVFFLLMPAVVDMFRSVTSGDMRRYALLFHPVYLIVGFANWLFDIQAKRYTTIGRADLPGSAYMWTMLGVSAVCITLLIRRYKRLEA